MSVNHQVTSLIASEEEERRVYATASSLFGMGKEQWQSQNTISKRKVRYVVGVVLSVLWLLFASFLALSRAKKILEIAPDPYIVQPYSLQNPPLYVSANNAEMTQ